MLEHIKIAFIFYLLKTFLDENLKQAKISFTYWVVYYTKICLISRIMSHLFPNEENPFSILTNFTL